MCTYVCVNTSTWVPGVQKRTSESLELELLAVVSHLVWVLGTKPPGLYKNRELLTIEPFL